jgi:hypothetical protein
VPREAADRHRDCHPVEFYGALTLAPRYYGGGGGYRQRFGEGEASGRQRGRRYDVASTASATCGVFDGAYPSLGIDRRAKKRASPSPPPPPSRRSFSLSPGGGGGGGGLSGEREGVARSRGGGSNFIRRENNRAAANETITAHARACGIFPYR